MSFLHSIFCNIKSIFERKGALIFSLIIYLMAVAPCLHYIILYFSIEAGVSIYFNSCVFLLILFTILFPFIYRYYKNARPKKRLRLIVAAAFCTAAAMPSLIYNHGWIDAPLSTLYITGILALTYALFKRWSILLWFLWLLLPFAVNLATTRYQISIGTHLISEILGASPQDAKQFLTVGNIALLLAWPVITLAFSVLLLFIINKCDRNNLWIEGCVIIAAAISISYSTRRMFWNGNYHRTPENYWLQIVQAKEHAEALRDQIFHIAENLKSSADPTPQLDENTLSSDCICILHIGESVRSDHLSIFGYKKNTTPHLEQNDHLIAFSDCVAAAPTTIPSTFAILTDARTDIRTPGIDDSLHATCGSIIDIFRSLHFDCYAFVNNEDHNDTAGAQYEKLLHLTFASGASKILTIPQIGNSHSQINQIADILDAERNKRVFCLVNNFGSHLPFMDFDHQRPAFPPADERAYSHRPDANPKVAEIVCNTYDCTIHYLDDYIHSLLNTLKGKPFIYLYVSDHGEYLGDRGIWVRNGDKDTFFNTSVCQVPFLIITSEEFEQQNPHIKQALSRLMEHRDMSIGHEHIFHTLLGIFGINSPYYNEDLDLSSERVLPYTGPHPSRAGKAIDGKKWY